MASCCPSRCPTLALPWPEVRQKAEREGASALNDFQRIVLGVEALEREVNNGGYHQFFLKVFLSSARKFATTIASSLQRIGRKKTATITQKAIKALAVSDRTPEEMIGDALAGDDQQLLPKLSRCDDAYYGSAEPIADRLFVFLKKNQTQIRLESGARDLSGR